MRKLTVLISAFAIAATAAAYADLAQPGEFTPDILDKPIVINGETMHVVRTIDKNNLDIKVLTKDRKETVYKLLKKILHILKKKLRHSQWLKRDRICLH